LAVSLAACNPDRGDGGGGGDGGGAAAGGDTSITLMLPFQKSLSFWSELLPEDLGYYKAEGISVEIQPSGGGTEALQQLLSNNVDMAMVAPAVILEAAAQGKELTVPYTDKHAGLFSIVVPEGSAIRAPEDLKGKTVGITDFGGGELPIVKAILGKAGLKEGQDVKLVAVGEGNPAVVRAIQEGRIDAYGASWSDFIPMMGLGMKLREVTYPDIQQLPSEVLVVRRDYFASNKAAVTKVARSMAKASYFVTQYPEKTLGLLRKIVPQDLADPDLAKLSLDIWLKIANYPKEGSDYTFGKTDPATWETLEQVARDHGGGNLRSDVDVGTIVNNDLIEQVNDFSRDDIKKQADALNVTFP